MSSYREYLRYAEQCSRMAEQDRSGRHRDDLVAMAHAWRKLAAEEERIAELVQAVDRLFPASFKTAEPVNPRKRFRGLIPRLSESLLFRRFYLH